MKPPCNHRKYRATRYLLKIAKFGEGLRLAKEKLGEKNIYYMNPSFDK